MSSYHTACLTYCICPVFLFDGVKYKCVVCPEHSSRTFSARKAVQHEGTTEHMGHLRRVDGRVASSDPLRPPCTPPRRHTTTVPHRHRANRYGSPLPPPSPPSGDEDSTAVRTADFSDGYEADQERDGEYLRDDEVSGHAETFTIHGPALPHDPPNQLYDNWGGFFSHCADPRLDEASQSVTAQNLNAAALDIGDESDGSDVDRLESDLWAQYDVTDPFDATQEPLTESNGTCAVGVLGDRD